MLFAIAQFLAGALLLLIGGEGVVRGASRLAILVRLSPLFIGLTVVSLGTSAPEMAVSVATAMRGQADITIGNVVGSNLFNMLMIVGVSAACIALPVERQITRFDVPVMLAATVTMWLMGRDGQIEFFEGVSLLAMLLVYFAISFRLGKQRRETPSPELAALAAAGDVDADTSSASGTAAPARVLLNVIKNTIILALGIGGLILGCEWFVAASVFFAREFGLSEAVIGLTIVSAGTSLPELVTSVAATIKGERGIAIGNAVGSTTLNILAVLGVTAVVAPSGILVDAGILAVDIPIMIGIAALSWVVFRTGHTIRRAEGVLLMLIYCGYVGFLLVRTGAVLWPGT